MGFLSLYTETVLLDALTGERISSEGDAEWWVRLRGSLPTIDFEATQRAMLADGIDLSTIDREKVEAGDMDGAKLAMKPDMTAFQVELLARSIVDWNLSDEHDYVLPLGVLGDELVDVVKRDQQVAVTKASVRRLPGDVFQKLFQAVNRLGRSRSAAEQAQFRGRADGSDPTEPARSTDPESVRA